jgi:TonB family protein
MRATTKLVVALVALVAVPAFAQPAPEPMWSRTPSPSQVLEAYPQSAMNLPGGSARIKCLPSPAGNLINCTVVSEDPAGVGFGPAAVALAAGFRLTSQAARRHAEGIVLPIRFARPEPAPPWRDAAFKTSPKYRHLGVVGPYYPERAERFGVGGEVIIDCRVEGDGALKDCDVFDFRPANFGFDESAIRMTRDGWMRAGPAPPGIVPPANGIWRFKIPYSDTKGRFAR